MTRIYLPKDMAALALGADRVARTLQAEAARRGLVLDVVRTGTRGAIWLEPLLEVETPEGRIAYGPVQTADVAGLLDAGLLDGGAHALRIGRPEEHSWFAGQTRLTFARCGIIDPVSVEDYRAHGGYAGLERALELGDVALVDEIKLSGLRGRGGAGLPDGHQVEHRPSGVAADRKYIVCNADEGDSGTFADRMLMEGDPLSLVEGMTIAAVAVGATQGLHLHPVGISARHPHHARRDRGRPTGRAARRRHHGVRPQLSTLKSGWAPAPISAARRPRCSKAWKASAASCAPSRRCRRSRGCSASRRS